MTERWKAIPGFPGYDVSDEGRVRSYWAYSGHGGGAHITDRVERILLPNPNRQGYLRVTLHANRKRYEHRIAYLVMLAFVGPRPKGMHVCHNNNDLTNNKLNNLRFDSPKGNNADKSLAARQRSGQKLDAAQVMAIRVRIAANSTLSYATVATEFNVSLCTVSAICLGHTFPGMGGPRTRRRNPCYRKLTDSQVIACRERYAANPALSHRVLAAELGISPSACARICSGRAFRNLSGPITKGRRTHA